MVGVETFDCLALAEEVRLETGGAFDVNARAGAGTGPPAFELARSSGRFVLRRPPAGQEGPPGLDLDLGAIGKGWALDKALEVLGEWSVGNALLHGGTSTALAVGSSTPEASPHSGWPVGAGGGWPGTPGRVLLAGRALSGSGTEVKGAHILDPRTGRPAAHQLAAWASAPSAALSDALSTAFFAMSAAEVEGVTRLHPDVWACLVLGYGDVRLYNESLFPALP
jgi:thiamine biosynthesis lipoprotein